MNKLCRGLLIIFALCLPPGLHASEQKIKILNDHELAAIKGGFCFLEKCEDPPGSGICQPFGPIAQTICDFTKCTYDEEIDGNTRVYRCVYGGPTTCTNSATYRQCVLSFTQSSCFDGPLGPCGFNIVPDCLPIPPDRMCACFAKLTDEPCDWTDCVTGP